MKNLITDEGGLPGLMPNFAAAGFPHEVDPHLGTNHRRKTVVLARWLSLLTSLSICFLTACSRQEATPLRVGSIPWPGFEPFYVARHLGYLDEKQVRLTEFTSTSEILRAFANGTIEAGLMTLDEALVLAQDVPDIRLVLVTDVSHGADVIMAKSEIASLKDLKGRRIGAETSALGAYVLLRALQLGEMTPQEVTIVPLQFSEHETSLKQGSVEAVVTFEPTRTKLRNSGARQIFDSSQIPGEIVDVLVVRDAYLQTHPNTVKHLLDAYYRARAYFKDKPQEAARIAAGRAKISPEEFLSSLEGLVLPEAHESRRMLIGQPPALLKNTRALMAVMLENGLLRKEVEVKMLFEEKTLARFLP